MVNKDSPIACSMLEAARKQSQNCQQNENVFQFHDSHVMEQSGMCRRCEMHFEIRNDLPCKALTATRLHNAPMRSSRLTAVYQRSQ